MVMRPVQSLRRFLLDRAILRPSRDPLDSGSKLREVLRTRAHHLECYVEQSPEWRQRKQLLVLKFPGTGGRAERASGFPQALVPEIATKVWTWNPPGYGRSRGRASLDRIADAALEFYDHVIEREAQDETTIWLCGNSLGCAVAMHVAAARAAESNRMALVLRNAPPLVDVVKHVASQYPLGRFMNRVAESLTESMNAMITAQRVEVPAVFFQSEHDSVVPPTLQNEIVERYAGPKQLVVLNGLDHSDLTTEAHERSMKIALDWLWDCTAGDSDNRQIAAST